MKLLRRLFSDIPTLFVHILKRSIIGIDCIYTEAKNLISVMMELSGYGERTSYYFYIHVGTGFLKILTHFMGV